MTGKRVHFADLHRSGDPLLLCNIWDAGSAQAVAAAGWWRRCLPATIRMIPAYFPKLLNALSPMRKRARIASSLLA